MPAIERVSIEQIVAAYQECGSVWKAGKKLGIGGQSVWERLKSIGHPMANRKWTSEEYDELRTLSENCTIGQMAQRLGRPYYAVAIKLSRMGIATKYKRTMKLKRGSGLDQKSTHRYMRDLKAWNGSLRKFCVNKGLTIDLFVVALQRYEPDFWKEYSRTSTDLSEAICPYCSAVYYPMTKKQKTCSRKCTADMKRDADYFGGKRRTAFGLAEGVCQLCGQQKETLAAHHVLGKQNDPDNNCLVAVCRGCHQIIGTLAGRRFVDSNEGWENLIQLVMARRMADKSSEYCGVYSCVDNEYLKAADLEEIDGPEESNGNTPGVHVEVEIV